MTPGHFDAEGKAIMVDVSSKEVTRRVAIAEGDVAMADKTLRTILAGENEKGDVLGVARLAGIMGAKRTAELVPLCHPLPLEKVTVDFTPLPPDRLKITATVVTTSKTGVEMEAMTAVSVAALTLYDMVKGIDREVTIEKIRLLEKMGGKSGHYTRRSDPS